MSDGPHKSLPLKPWWKEVAKRADNSVWTVEQERASALYALQRDLAGIPLRPIKAVVGAGDEGSLSSFNTQNAIDELDRMRVGLRGSTIGTHLVDGIIKQLQNGLCGKAAYIRGIAYAADQSFCDHIRSIEEHYCREAGKSSAMHIRGRLHDVRKSINFVEFANRHANEPHVRGLPPLERQSGLDEGPVLSS